MDRKDALSEKLLGCDRIDTNSDSDNLIEEIRTMIESERLRQTNWQRLTVFCLAALGIVGLMLVGRHGGDRKLLAIAAAVEKQLGA